MAEKKPVTAKKRRVLGGVDIALGVLLVFMIFAALPARWWPVDVGGSALAALLVASGIGLVTGTPWSHRLAVVTGWVTLTLGAVLVTALAFTASHVAGLYGPVGQGGALILFAVALLIVPYLVALPAAQLYVLARRSRTDEPPPAG